MFCAVWRDHVLRQSEARTVDDVKAWLEREGYTYRGQPKRAGMNLEIVRIENGMGIEPTA